MKRAAILCDGAKARRATKDWELHELRSDTVAGALNIKIPSLADKLSGSVVAEAIDLVRIASFVYWADQMVTRPVDVDVFGEKWKRQFLVVAPVTKPALWNQPSIRAALSDVLSYGTDDEWDFDFEEHRLAGQQHMFQADPAHIGSPSSVLLFSGGTDSLCAAMQEAGAGRRPLLISHGPSPRIKGEQKRLAEGLRLAFKDEWHFPHEVVEVSKVREEERERTQRSRGFLYSAIGASVAAGFGLQDVVLADNGWVSVGLPVSGQTIGAKMSRTTHPRFQHLFNRLLELVLPGVGLRNPLLFKTRTDTLELLKRHRAEDLLRTTRSCVAARLLPAGGHCGTCSQCIDRRIAVSACGLQGHDVTYTKNVFLDDLTGGALMLAESYVRLMRDLLSLSVDELPTRYIEVLDCATPDLEGGVAALERICQMLLQQADTINVVLTEEAKPVMANLMKGEFSANCMVRLALAARPTGRPGRWSARNPETIVLTSREEAEEAERQYQSRVPIRFDRAVSGSAQNVEVEVGGNRVRLPEAEFVFLLRLAVQLKNDPDGYCLKGNNRNGGGLAEEGFVPGDVDNAILRLRGAIVPALGATDPKKLIQVDRGRVRLSVHPRFVHIDEDALREHPSERIRRVMQLLPVPLGGMRE